MKKLYKDRWNRKILGVFGGIGQLIGLDPNILRIIAIMLIIPLGVITLPIIYFTLGYFLPEGPRVFIQPTYKRLYKNTKNKVFLGVISGVADYLRIDVNLLRIAFVVICFLTGFFPLFFAYIVANSLLPLKPNAS